MIGPPTLPPNWFCFSSGFGTPDLLLKNEFAASALSRFCQNALPRSLLVPEGVTMRTELAPPAESAPCTDVVMLNSATLSEVGRFGRKSREFVLMKLSWTLMPSWVTCVHVGRPPLMPVFMRVETPGTPACSRMSCVMSRLTTGSARICFCSTVRTISGVVVCTSGLAAPVTSTVSLSWPIARRAVSEYSWPTLT